MLFGTPPTFKLTNKATKRSFKDHLYEEDLEKGMRLGCQLKNRKSFSTYFLEWSSLLYINDNAE